MKKKEKYYVLNNQEDEDGYTLYPRNAILYENEKKKQAISHNNNRANAEGSAKQVLYGGVRILPRFER